MSRLITASLIGSVEWFLNSPPSWKQKAYQDLKNTVGRAKWDPSVAIKKGIKFENVIYRMLSNNEQPTDVSDNFSFFLDKCAGGSFQNKNKRFIDITIDEETAEYCLYVKEDVLFKSNIVYPDRHIQDIKTSAKWGGRSKYLNTAQHKLYCLVEKIPTFEYLVAVWENAEDENNLKIESVHTVEYKVEDFKALEEEVIERVKRTIGLLKSDDELWELYTTKFSLY